MIATLQRKPLGQLLLAKGLVFGGVTLVVTLVGGIPVIYGLGPGVAATAVLLMRICSDASWSTRY